MNFESPSISSSKHQTMKFFLSDLKVICTQSWGHIEVYRALQNPKTSPVTQTFLTKIVKNHPLISKLNYKYLQLLLKKIKALQNSCELLRQRKELHTS